MIREGKATTNPAADWRFELGDILVVIGGHAEVDAAERLLTVAGEPAPGRDRDRESGGASVTVA